MTTSSCWLWGGSYFPNGYGQAWWSEKRRPTQAHRLVYRHLVGEIPEGMQLDHLCRVLACVNPEHLRVVTCRQNIMAVGSTCRARANVAKTHCPKGHAYDSSNTFLARGKRSCRTCKNAGKRERRASARGFVPALDAACFLGSVDAATPGTSSSVARLTPPEGLSGNPLEARS